MSESFVLIDAPPRKWCPNILVPGEGSPQHSRRLRIRLFHSLLLGCLLLKAGLLPLSATEPSPPLVSTNEVGLPLVIAPPQPLLPPVIRPPAWPWVPSPPSPLPVVTLPVTNLLSPWPVQGLSGSTVSLKEWAVYTGSSAPRRIAESPHVTYEIRHARGTALLRIGTSRATIFGTDVMLSHPAHFQAGEPCLNRMDCEKTLFPLFWPASTLLANTNRIVVLDPGHGGRDVGTQSAEGRRFEKNLTLDWAMRVKPLLEAQGLTVVLTRTNDSEVSLPQRVLVAEESKASIFVSLHLNSTSGRSQRRGLEAYALTPPGLASTIVRDGEDNHRLVFPNNAFDTSNTFLAWLIQRTTTRGAGAAVDGGVQHARFMAVLRGQNRPAVLVEGGYLSHPEDGRKLSDPAHRQKLAQGVAQAIQQFFELSD